MADAGGHMGHDPLDVAAAADRGASLPMALGLCGSCLDLRADLLAVAAAVPFAAMPRRPRDFTLTAAEAARLRSRRWRRMLDAFGSARDEISRPLAAGFATLGVVGLLLTAVPAVLPTIGGSSAAAPTDAPYVVMELGPVTGSQAPGVTGGGDAPEDTSGSVLPNDRSPLLLVSGAFLGASGVLVAARALAKRRGPVR